MKKHHLWMIIGCVLPLLFIFFLPIFGAGSGELLFVFIVLCFGVHLLMMGHHGNNDDSNHEAGEGGNHYGSH